MKMKKKKGVTVFLCIIMCISNIFIGIYPAAGATSVKKPKINKYASVYAEIPELGLSFKVRENDVKYGASFTKFVYTYYAYCVKNWGNKQINVQDQNGKKVKMSIAECTRAAVRQSDNYTSRAVLKYIQADEKRYRGYINWLKKALGKTPPTVTDGYKYRIAYKNDRASAFCPWSTAKENATLWKYIWKDGYENKANYSKQRYTYFFRWTSYYYSGGSYGKNCYVKDFHCKVGQWGDSNPELSVYTHGGFYDLILANGKTYHLFISYMVDHYDPTSENDMTKVEDYLISKANQKIKKKDNNGAFAMPADIYVEPEKIVSYSPECYNAYEIGYMDWTLKDIEVDTDNKNVGYVWAIDYGSRIYMRFVALSPGTTTVTVSVGDKSMTSKIKVLPYQNPVSSIKIGNTTVSGKKFNKKPYVLQHIKGIAGNHKVKYTCVPKDGWSVKRTYYANDFSEIYFPAKNGHVLNLNPTSQYTIYSNLINQQTGQEVTVETSVQ